MTTTDTDALKEIIAAALWNRALDNGERIIPDCHVLAAAVLPIIAAQVQAAKAAAWDEGYEAGMLDTYRLGRDMDLTITPAPNPYRETGDQA